MKSVLTPQQLFSHVSSPQIQRSTFDRSHGWKGTFNAGLLIPVYWDEAYPGDTFTMKTSLFGRLSTPIKPVMDNMFIDIHYFSVPIRILWANFKKFMGEQNNPGDTTNFVMPTVTAASGGFTEGSIYDFLGLPTKTTGTQPSVRSDVFRAYAKIWNEWYRDENLQNSTYCPTDDGPDTVGNYIILPRGKRKDYFTSALPWAQKGTAVSIPLGTSASITGSAPVYTNSSDLVTGAQNKMNMRMDSNGSFPNGNDVLAIGNTSGGVYRATNGTPSIQAQGLYPANLKIDTSLSGSTLTADLSTATASTINQLRQGFQIQRMLEKDARGGTRYTEKVRAHFGVMSPDARQQRPEYLGGGTTAININPIAQTGATVSGQTPQGNLAAMGTLSAHGLGFTKSFTEHEIVIGLASVRADLNYQQGIAKEWLRSTQYDFYWPTLAHLGEQAILNKEIYYTGTPATDNAAFGYQERYAELRYKPSRITGRFRSNSAAPLDTWHLAQNFSGVPTLGDLFIQENPPINRIIAVNTEPAILLDVFFNLKTARPMPVFSVPGMIDHF